MSTELTVEQLFDRYTTDEQVKEATALKTIRTGPYRLYAKKIDLRVVDSSDTEKNPNAIVGRQYAHIQAEAKDRESGDRKGTIFFNASWEEYKRENKQGEMKQDGQSKLWGQLTKVFDEKNVGKLVKDILPNYPFDAFVDESFIMPDGTFKSYQIDKGPEEAEKQRKALVEAGGEPINFVRNIFKVKV